MKNTLLLLLLLTAFITKAQDYDRRWDKVIDFEIEDKIQSALKETDSIYYFARKDKNEIQLIKSLFFKVRYIQILEENAETKIIKILNEEKKAANPVAKAILESFYADVLIDYYHANVYNFRDNTHVAGKLPEDINTWRSKNFLNEISDSHKKSLNEKELLYKIRLSQFETIFDLNYLSGKTNRSLYDLLAERYILSDLINSNGKQYLDFDKQLLFKDTKDFLKLTFSDTVRSNEFKDKLLFQQELERFYISKQDTLSLQRSVLRRMQYAYTKFNFPNKEEIYLAKLLELSEKWGNSPFSFHAKLKAAELYKNLADKKIYPEYLKKAVELCNNIISNAKLTNIAPNALTLKNSIAGPKLNFKAEASTIAGKPSLAQITFKNCDTINIAFYKISKKELESDDINYFKYTENNKPHFEKLYNLPIKTDHFEYTTEVIIPSLSSGSYVVSIAPKKDDEYKYVNFAIVETSKIAYLTETRDNEKQYQILDNESGKPVKGGLIICDNKKYTTDKDGKAIIKYSKKHKDQNKNNRQTFLFIYKNDTISTQEYLRYSYSESQNEKDYFAVVPNIYFDRSIYRPGQTVYFKGIITHNKNGVSSTASNIYVNINIYDVAHNEIEQMRIKTNEFGSFTSQFKIPENILTGDFYIKVDEDEEPESDENYNQAKDEHPFWDYADFYYYNRFYFKVEEYKRPTFEVIFEPVKAQIKLNETATVTGKAKSYNGANLTGAKVIYRVKRITQELRPFYGIEDSTPITEGETRTDEEGNFIVSFVTEPNKDINPKDLPVFIYEIYSEVTDISGETHEKSFTVKAGYHSLVLDADVPLTITPHTKNIFTFNSTNLNRQFTAATGEVKIYRLAKPKQQLLRKRPWPAPEIQTISQEEFIKAFPYIPYMDDTNEFLARESLVFSKNINTGDVKEISLDNLEGWQSGEYELVFTATDSGNHIIETTKKFSFKKDESIPEISVFSYRIINNATYIKDRYLEIELYSSLENLYVNLAGYIENKILYENIIHLEQKKKIIKIPFGKYTDILFLRLDYVWQNEYFKETSSFITNNKYNDPIILTTAIKNIMQPGEKETWSFTVKGKDNEIFEVLASMYDASLDDFAYEKWSSPDRLRNYTYYNPYYKDSEIKDWDIYASYNNTFGYMPTQPEDKLNDFGFNINRINKSYIKRKIEEKKIFADGGFILTGTVSDLQGPLPGANVGLMEQNLSVSTDLYGNFSIIAKKGQTLVISYLGYKTMAITIKKHIHLDILLEDNLDELENVVLEAYRNTDYELANQSINPSFATTLQGQVPGLNITSDSGQPGAGSSVILRGSGSINSDTEPLIIVDGMPIGKDQLLELSEDAIASLNILKDAAATSIYGNRGANGVLVITTKKSLDKQKEELNNIKTRKNLNETAFFYPQLYTDKNGDITFSFTAPEALTQWKLRLLAHNKKTAYSFFEHMAITQKDLMIIPNMPRFLREKDTITIMAKVTNITSEPKNGNAMLQLFDAVTMQPLDVKCMNADNMKPFTLDPKGNTAVSWTITVPEGIKGIQYKVLAKAGTFTDGIESTLPVLTNLTLVTESIPIWVREKSEEKYTFDNLKNNTSATLRNHKLTFEYTSNPAWFALQSLPYLMEYEHECAEQIFSRFYANAIATQIVNNNPKIAEVFDNWRKAGKPISKLEMNEELKSADVTQSPWLRDLQSEEEKKKWVALLFEIEKMKTALSSNLYKLQQKQMSNGAFSWFEGGNPNSYITRHIIAGLGHLNKLNIKNDTEAIQKITAKGIDFIDAEFLEENNSMISSDLHSATLHYLYTRSFFTEQYPVNDSLKKIITKQFNKIKNNWTDYSLYEKGMAALSLYRFGETVTAKKILEGLRQTSSNNRDWGMYWIENKAGLYWYNAPIETQALLIEAFTEIENDIKSADAMKVWLIKNKQTTNWPTTKATTEAIYALLMKGSDWISIKDSTTIQLGNKDFLEKKLAKNEKEAGTGYIKISWNGNEITKNIATVSVKNESATPGFGGFYWQYFEETDKIIPAQKGLINIKKELYLKQNKKGETILQKINNKQNTLKTGDLITIRIVINASENLEYVHLEDTRASAFEPIDVISGHTHNGGLSYYKSTKDSATHFFFDTIQKGTYVLEYDVRVNNAGQFTTGISRLQSMYAPEFSAHSSGGKINIKQ